MSSNFARKAPSTSAELSSENHELGYEERQKSIDHKGKKRALEDHDDRSTWEADSFEYLQEDLEQHQQIHAIKQQKLTKNTERLTQMKHKLEAQREKVAEMEKTFLELQKRLKSEQKVFKDEEEFVGSLEREVQSRQMILFGTRQSLNKHGDLSKVSGSGLEAGRSERHKTRDFTGPEAGSSPEVSGGLRSSPSSSHSRLAGSEHDEERETNANGSALEGYRYHLGSPEGKLRRDTLTEIRSGRGEYQIDTVQSAHDATPSDTLLDTVIKRHRRAILAKAIQVKQLINNVSSCSLAPFFQGRPKTTLTVVDTSSLRVFLMTPTRHPRRKAPLLV